MLPTGTLQYGISIIFLLWISASCQSAIPSRSAARVITAKDSEMKLTNKSLCHNATGPQRVTFQRLIIDDNILYVGATNKILQINLTSFKIDHVVSQGPVQDCPECLGPHKCSGVASKPAIRCVDNFNRLLMPHRDQLIVCGSAVFGTCSLLTLKNISKPFNLTEDQKYAMMCSDSKTSQIARVGGEMTVASIFTSSESPLKDIFYLGSSNTNLQMVDILFPPRATQDVSRLHFTRISSSTYFEVTKKKKFLLSWTTPLHGFILWSTNAESGSTKLVRLCHTSLNELEVPKNQPYSKASYTETTVECGDFKNASVAYQANGVLYILMRTSDDKFALCSKNMTSINEHFRRVREDCLAANTTRPATIAKANIGDCKGKNYRKEYSTCGIPQTAYKFFPAITSKETFNLQMDQRYLWPIGKLPPTAFAIDQFEGWEIAFFGTVNGTVLKTEINDQSKTFIETITLEDGSPVLHDVGFDESASHFYAMTADSVYQIAVSSCAQYSSCGDCVGSGDPYCGWCVLQSKCTTKATCGNPIVSERWMSTSGNSSECPYVAAVLPSTISVNAAQELSLKLSGMVPKVNYTCDFTVDGASIGNSPLTGFPSSPKCQSPVTPPTIPFGRDYVSVSLEIKALDSVVARGSLSIYNCSRTPFVNRESMCGSCLAGLWSCEWCTNSGTCSDSCTGQSSLTNRQDCPSVIEVIDANIDIPVGKGHKFVLSSKNLPNLNYDCDIDVCDGGSKVIVPASPEGKNNRSCLVSKEQLQCEKEDSIISISLKSGDYVVDTTSPAAVQVGLFNCTGSKAECGLCIITHQRHPECSWCNNVCIPSEDCKAGVAVTNITSCPTAKIDQVSPLNGPVDGGTEITIDGTNLATTHRDIKELFLRNTGSLADVNCTINPEKYIPSNRIVCKTERPTVLPFKGSVYVKIDYISRRIRSDEEFEFKEVNITGYEPNHALRGTDLTFTGMNLDVGNNAKMKFGSVEIDCPNRKSDEIICKVTDDHSVGPTSLTVMIDGYSKVMKEQLVFVEPPAILGLAGGRKSLSSFNKGGVKVGFRFSSLHGVQSAVLSVNNGTTEETCNLNEEDASVICAIPSYDAVKSGRRSKRQIQSSNEVPAKLVINNATEIPLQDEYQLTYIPDPTIYELQQIPCHNADSTQGGAQTSVSNNASSVSVPLSGKNLDAAAIASDYSVLIRGSKGDASPVKCIPGLLNSELLLCHSRVDEMQKYANKEVTLTITVGNLTHTTDTTYCPGGTQTQILNNTIIGVIIGIVVLLVMIIVILICIQKHKAIKQKRERQQIMKLLDKLENRTRENARKAYFELQLGYMTTLTDNISDSITYLPPASCFMKALFNTSKPDHPMLAKIIDVPNIKLSGVDDFAAMLKNKEFLLLLVKTLEEQKHFTVKEKGHFASLLAICLFDDMVYFTKVMMELLSELIQKHVGKNPKLLLRRSESVVEKMVSHWLCITLYSECIREQAGKPLFLLTKAIHFLVNSAPCDVIANKAVNSLNEMTLLGTEVPHHGMTLRATVMADEKRSEVFEVKVVNCDTITQVKEKVIEVYYRDRPYSECPKPDKMQLELIFGGQDSQGSLLLSDLDSMSHKEGSYTRINTLRHYNVPEDAEFMLSPSKEDSVQAAEAGSPPPESKKKRLYHLIHPRDKETNGAVEEDDGGKGTKALIGNLINQPFQEIFLTRMVKSKTTVQEYVDKVFDAILKPTPISRSVKYFFQFLDKEAAKHKISDVEVLHIWKNNSLLLRYWVNILKNPEFLFDVNKTAIVDSCLNVITQAFMDACTTTNHKLGQDSPSNKLLYAKDAEKYKGMVSKFFVDVSNEETVSEEEITGILKDVSRKYANEFNKQAAALELFKYVDKYRMQVLDAVENESLYSRLNETIRKISPDTNGRQTAYETSILI